MASTTTETRGARVVYDPTMHPEHKPLIAAGVDALIHELRTNGAAGIPAIQLIDPRSPPSEARAALTRRAARLPLWAGRG